MEVLFLGNGGMMPMPNRFLSSVLLRRAGELYLFDCGEGTQIPMKKSGWGYKKINSIFISHTHADHVTGLIGVLMLIAQTDREDVLHIYGPHRIKDYVDSLSILEPHIGYPIEVNEITEDGIIIDESDYYVTAKFLTHSRPCVGYSFTEKERQGEFLVEKAEEYNIPCGPLWGELQDGNTIILADNTVISPDMVLGEKRKGRKFAFVTDTRPCENAESLAKDADIFACESMYLDEDVEQAVLKKHMTVSEASNIALKSDVRKMVLIHISPRYINRELRMFEATSKKIFENSIVAKELLKIEIPLYK